MSQQKQAKKLQIVRGLGYGLVAALIFVSGWGVGSGRIVLSQDQLFRKSVQKGIPNNLDYASVEEVYDTLRQDYDGQLDVNKLLEGLKAGLATAAGDPYTEFLNPDDAQEFNSSLNGTFIGIGAELSKDEDGNVVVVSPISGFPAEKAGLQPKDIIIEVDGKTTSGQSLSEVVNQIRGEENTTVKLKIVRDKSKELDIEVPRQKITIPSVTSKIIDGNIGYLKIARFSEDTVELAQKAANEFKQAGVKGVVLDVRSDPGGLLDASVKVSSLWLKPGSTVLEEKRSGIVIKTYRSSGNPVLQSIPTVVLINEGSASASEIVAGALKDNGAASLLGEKTFGKGSVQQLEKFSDGSVLKVTIARWYTPKGINIDKEGIKPDSDVRRTEADIKASRDPQLDAAIKKLQPS